MQTRSTSGRSTSSLKSVCHAGISHRRANASTRSADRDATARTDAIVDWAKASACIWAMNPLPTSPTPTCAAMPPSLCR